MVDLFDEYDSESILDDSAEQGADTGKVLSNKEKACMKILDDIFVYLTSADRGNEDLKASRHAQIPWFFDSYLLSIETIYFTLQVKKEAGALLSLIHYK